ncbi:NAD(P)H-dependent oxidoreductase [Glaciimonas immobilis]|nr:NAD(P)H-dependent oxidoreductase [Glaciimonas immobilis]
MKLLGLSGSPSVKPRCSKTLIAIEMAMEFAGKFNPSVSTEIINLRDHDVQFCDGRNPEEYEGVTQEIIKKIQAADGLLVATPMYRGSYTGILKNIFDIIPNDALAGKPVGLIATAASDHHYLALEHELKPLLGFFHAFVLPGSVYINNDHYSEKTLIDVGIIDRLRQLGEGVVRLYEHLPQEALGASGPVIIRKVLTT